MDEILIDERKYVSSKQAAKVTGYAKDYIGQLCREGRVPARLVGRSWYVLETAIHDHRFGKQGIEEENIAQTKASSAQLPSTWESPRYEASPIEVLPSINRLGRSDQEEIVPHPILDTDNQQEATENLQDSWRAWFERRADDSEPATAQEDQTTNERKEVEVEGGEMDIPIHAIYDKQPPEELLPQRYPDLRMSAGLKERKVQETGKKSERQANIIKICGVSLAILSALLATANTGYFDRYALSFNQVGEIVGITIYNK